jgi:hypothetical protein
MKTETKIKRIRNFLSARNNELFKVNANPITITLSVLFDIDFSQSYKRVGFSRCLKVENFDEVLEILEKVAINISRDDLREKLIQKCYSRNIDKGYSFYMIIKGNKLKKQ